MKTTLIRNATLVNEGKSFEADLFISHGRISRIAQGIQTVADEVIDARGLHLIHFREPGLTHKADIRSESRAAAAGGVTSFMEMPNTSPQTLTQSLLEQKYEIGAQSSAVNYSFFMGASNDNLSEVLRTDPVNVCGVKIFMGSSTGNMLVDDAQVLEKIFSECPMLIATHCEKEEIVRKNMAEFQAKYGDNLTIDMHPLIRSREACYASSSAAVVLAKKHNTRLHILHISTVDECGLFQNNVPLAQKRITAEACIHHLWFSDQDYARLGNFIKWNPAVKTAADRDSILRAVLEDLIDIIATDHAPHTLEEKQKPYVDAPSGGPLVQHGLPAMLELMHQGKISLEKVVEKMCHSPAVCFQVKDRGFLREGAFADLVLVNLNSPWKVTRENLLYKCGWSPFEGTTFQSAVASTFVNGEKVYHQGRVDDSIRGQRLVFER
jgi:dihydroorotase